MNIITDTLYYNANNPLVESFKIFSNFLSSVDISKYVEEKTTIQSKTVVSHWWKLEQDKILTPLGTPISVVLNSNLKLDTLEIARDKVIYFAGMLLINLEEDNEASIDAVKATLTEPDDNIQTDLLTSCLLKILDEDFGMANILYQYFLFWEIMFKEEKMLDKKKSSPNMTLSLKPFNIGE